MAIQWNDITQSALDGDYNGYIRYANQILRISGVATEASINGMRVFQIKENTRYRVGMIMQNRFRLGCVPSLSYEPSLTNYVFHPEDTNGSACVGEYRELEITSEPGQTYLCVGAWTEGAAVGIFDTLNTVTLYEAEEVQIPITGIEVTTLPGKRVYKPGETLDTAGMVVTVIYEDDSREAVEDYTLSGYDGNIPGVQTITVHYEEFKTTFSVTVLSVTKIEIVTPPDKDVYKMDTSFEPDGIQIDRIYSDESRDTLTEGYTFSGFDSSTPGEQTIVVHYGELTASFVITVLARLPFTKIEVTTPPSKSSYKQGEEFVAAGLVVKGTLEDGTEKDVTDYTLSGYDGTLLGEQTITVHYGELTASFQIKVIPNTISATCGYPTTADVRATLDLYSGVLTFEGQGAIKAFSSSSWLWNTSYRTFVKKVVFDERITAIGSYTCYYCTELEEAVIPVGITAINSYAFYYCSKLGKISSLANVQSIGTYAFYKTALSGEIRLDSVTALNSYTFSYSNQIEKVWIGASVTSIHKYAFRYCSGISEIYVDREYQIIDAYPWGASNANVTWSTTPLSGLVLQVPPDKTEYLYGEEFQLDGICVRILYEDGTYRDSVDISELSVQGYSAKVVGTQQVTITYRSVSCSMEVTVRNYLAGIKVLSPPAKTAYSEGDEQDYSGLVVAEVYADGAVVEIMEYTVSDIDRELLGEQSITVTSGEHTATFTITGDFPTTLRKLLGEAGNMEIIRNDVKNDDKTDVLDGVDWFSFNGVIADKIYISGNNWIGFGKSDEQLRICRRDGAIWYIRRLEGRLTNGHRFLKLRVEGFTTYGYTSDSYRLNYEVYLFDDNSLYLYLIQTPTAGSYLGTSALICGEHTLSYSVVTYEKEPQMFSFYAKENDGKSWNMELLPHEYLIHGLRILTLPQKTQYRISEDLDLSGIEVALETELEKVYFITDYDVSGYDAFVSGEQIIEISKGEYAASLTVLVIDGFRVRFLYYDHTLQEDVIIKEETVNYGSMIEAPELVERNGYVFTGWNGDFQRIVWDTDIYAEFIPKNVLMVIFCDHAGKILKKQFVMRGASATPPEVPPREGYVFDHWDQAFIYVTEDLVVNAVYTPRSDSFTVAFTDWNDKVLKTETVNYGGDATAPAIPKREGYYFLAWSQSFGYVTKDTTVQAVYRKNRGTVVAEIYNGSRLMGEIRMAMDCTLSQKLNGECTMSLTTLYQYGSFIQKRYRIELDGLIFDVSNLEKKTQNGMCILTVKGEHVSYILNDDNYTITEFYYKGSPSGCLKKLLSGTPFTAGIVEFTKEVELKINRECTRRNALMQLVALCGGELEYDKYSIGIREHIGRTEPIEVMETENVKNVGMSYSAAENTETYSLELYRKIEIALGDEIHLVFTPLGINKTKRIKGIDWNPFNFRKISVTVGGYRASLSDALYQIEESGDTTLEDVQALAEKVDGLTDSFESLSGSLGGFNVMSVAELPENPDMNTIYLIQGTVEVK